MKSENFIKHPDLNPYFNDTMHVLMQESDRGAILLGVSQIDETLQGLFERFAPTSISKARKKDTFSFNGPFGSLSSKLDIALVCRILPENLIEAIHRIRKIRNKLAHKIESFDLLTYSKELNEILALTGPNADAGINKLSTNVMMTLFVAQMADLKDENGCQIFDSREAAIRYISENDEVKSALIRQQPKWTFAIAVGVICAIIISHREKICAAMEGNTTMLDLVLKKRRNTKSGGSNK